MRLLEYSGIFLILVVIIGCGDASISTSSIIRSPITSPALIPPSTNISESFSWFLKNHADIISNSDSQRKIIQIKVLDQTILGFRQCGYHGVRNFFFLAALGEAILSRNSDLIKTIYQELHDEKMFEHFVEELAKIKGCPITHFHQNFPNENELRTLYSNAKASFPSSLSLEDIIEYGVVKDSAHVLIYYKNPPEDKETYFDEFLSEIERDFNFKLSTSEHLKDLMKINFPSPRSWQLFAIKKFPKPFPIYISLQGAPGHAVSAAFFMPKDEQKPTLLFADSWHDLSFLSGWSKATIDVLYQLLASFDDAKNLGLLRECLARFTRSELFWESDEEVMVQLSTLLARMKADRIKTNEVLDRLAKHMKEFDSTVQDFRLQTASLYPAVKELIEKIRISYETALR